VRRRFFFPLGEVRTKRPSPVPPLSDRLEKEALHELGHTFGLRHCADSDCVMSYSKGVQCADRKFAVFCPACRDLMLWYMETGNGARITEDG